MIKNETIETLKKRRSCRAYKPVQITDEELDTVLDAGTWAPTSMGKQSPILVSVQDKETIAELSRVNAEIFGRPGTDPFYGAPTAILVLSDADRITCVEDGSLVLGNMMNAAASIGLGSCWIHRAKETFEREEGKALLEKWGIRGNYRGIGCCILGYSAEVEKTPTPRKADYITKIK